MRIDWQQSLQGFSARQIRDVLRKLPYSDTALSVGFIAEQLARYERAPRKALAVTAERLVDDLIASNIIEPDPGAEDLYVLTPSGVSLRAARATPRFKRARAERAIGEMLAVVDRINADPVFLHDVAKVSVFGSYISDLPDLGDIDVEVELRPRWTPRTNLGEQSEKDTMTDAFLERFPMPRSHDEFFGRLFWPETVTRRLLRTDPAMAFSNPGDLERMGCAYWVIYPVPEEVAAKPDWSCERAEIVFRLAAA